MIQSNQDRSRHVAWRLCAPLAAMLLALSACSETPVTGRNQLILLPEDQASQMGLQAYEEILRTKGVSQNTELQNRVDEVGRRLKQVISGDTDWQFTVLDDETPNAFALPGGKVGVHTGLFKVVENDAQLAAVLAHEIAHVTARHSSERMSQQMVTQAGLQVVGATVGDSSLPQLLGQAATLGVILPFNRKQESEADEIGLTYMARAGYDPRAAVEVWQNFKKAGGERPPEFLSTHPSPDTRIERLRALLPNVMPIYEQNARRTGG